MDVSPDLNSLLNQLVRTSSMSRHKGSVHLRKLYFTHIDGMFHVWV